MKFRNNPFIRNILLYPIIFISLMSAAVAETQFINYKGISIPIEKTGPLSNLAFGQAWNAPPNCQHLAPFAKNVIYVDDIGGLKESGQEATGGGDPNGFQDMVVVLALANKHKDKINLLGVGTTNNLSADHDILKDIVAKSGLGVPVWSQSQIKDRIDFYMACSEYPNLAVAMGGEVNKATQALEDYYNSPDDFALVERISISALTTQGGGATTHNTRKCGSGGGGSPCPYYDGDPYGAFMDLLTVADTAENDIFTEFTGPLFRAPYYKSGNGLIKDVDDSTDFDTEELNDLYLKIRVGLIGVRDRYSGGRRLLTGTNVSSATLTSSSNTRNSVYENNLIRDSHSSEKDTVLKIADFLTVAMHIWPDEIDQIHRKDFIFEEIEEAIEFTYDN